MKKAALLLSFALTLSVAAPAGVLASEEYEDIDSHPLRVAAYAVHPVGVTLEYLIFRPLHFIVSRPGLDEVFGHESDLDEPEY